MAEVAPYKPMMMARAVRMLGEVVNPIKVRELNEIVAALNKWKEKTKKLNGQFNENMSNKIIVFTALSRRTPRTRSLGTRCRVWSGTRSR